MASVFSRFRFSASGCGISATFVTKCTSCTNFGAECNRAGTCCYERLLTYYTTSTDARRRRVRGCSIEQRTVRREQPVPATTPATEYFRPRGGHKLFIRHAAEAALTFVETYFYSLRSFLGTRCCSAPGHTVGVFQHSRD